MNTRPFPGVLVCRGCGNAFHPERRNQQYHDEACKQAASRRRQVEKRNAESYKQRQQLIGSFSDLPYTLVNYGIDTLVLNVRYRSEDGKPRKGDDALLPDEIIALLNAWQAVAREQEQPVSTGLEFDHAKLQILPHGAGKGRWRWVLTCPAFNLLVSRGRLNGVIAQVRFSARYLWSSEDASTHQQSIWPFLIGVHDFLSEVFTGGRDLLSLQVSEIHLCADLAGWDIAACQWERSFISRAQGYFVFPNILKKRKRRQFQLYSKKTKESEN